MDAKLRAHKCRPLIALSALALLAVVRVALGYPVPHKRMISQFEGVER